MSIWNLFRKDNASNLGKSVPIRDPFTADLAAIEALKSYGADLNKEHECDFQFYGEPASLEILKNELLKFGFSVTPGERSYGSLNMTRKFKPKLRIMNEVTQQLLELCHPLDIDYDGWGALIEK